MSENKTNSKKSPWSGVDFILPVLLLFATSFYAATYGAMARELGITGAFVAYLSPWLMFAIAILCPLVLAQTHLARLRHEVTLVLVICCAASAPVFIYLTTSSVPLTRTLTREELADIDNSFHIPVVHYGSSGEGHRLRVRRGDDTPQLRKHLAQIEAVVSKN